MGQKTIEISFSLEASLGGGGLYAYVYTTEWFNKHKLDSKRTIIFNRDYDKQVIYVKGWEIEDAKETKD